MARTCRSCGGVLGRDCFNEQDCLMISEQMQQQASSDPNGDNDFAVALDYIKQLCFEIEGPTSHESTANAVMNAMTFYEKYRPRTAPVKLPPYEVDGLPF